MLTGGSPHRLTVPRVDDTLALVNTLSHVRRGMTATVEELAPRPEDEARAPPAPGRVVEGRQHMSPEYRKGIRRILTVSADTELVSAPAYLRAASHAPALNNFGSAVSIIQDELA